MDVCTLIILIKFQNFCTRTSSCTVAPHGSSWKSWQDASRHHWDFTAWPLDQSWLGIKAAATGQNLHSVFKFSSFWLCGFKIHTSSGLQILVTFLPPTPILLLPYLVLLVLLVGYRHWPALWWHLNQHIVQKHSVISQLSKHLQQTSSS